MKRSIVICGPTASGKTDLAHYLAIINGGEIVNADSMQLYKQLPIITASPNEKQKTEIKYHLYNFIDVDQEFSVAKYAAHAGNAIKEINARGKLPILVGGSGMYINALLYGYNEIPEISPEIRLYARNLREKIGPEEFFKRLQVLDPEISNILNVNDSQRAIRAYEVVTQTGNSITYYQKLPPIKPLEDFSFKILFLLPNRQFLYSLCNSRFIKMFDNGAVEEIRNIIKNYGNIKTSAGKALGVQEIISYLNKDMSKDEVILRASTKTRQYAKRQITWFSHQIKDKETIIFNDLKQYEDLKFKWKQLYFDPVNNQFSITQCT